MMGVRIAWLAICICAAVWTGSHGVPMWLNLGVLVCSIFPAITGMFLRGTTSEARVAEYETALWIGLATAGVAVTGGSGSPLLVLFGVALAVVIVAGYARLMLEAAIFSVAGYVAALVVASLNPGLAAPYQSVIATAYGAGSVIMMAVLAVVGFYLVASGLSKDGSRGGGDKRQLRLKLNQMEVRARLAERELAEARAEAGASETALDARTRFFAQTSHELRTPLNAILGFTDMMRNAVFGPLPEKYQEYADLVWEGGRDLEMVVDDVLDLSRIEAGRYEIRPEPVSLNDLAKDAVNFLKHVAERKSIKLSVDGDADVEAFADSKAVRQIALNLISNAVKFTPEGGEVIVSVVEGYTGALLAVSDTGEGLSAEEIGRMSRAFEQGEAGRKHKGSGLGLSVVRAFAELHGGRLDIESREGGGATVAVFFPNEPV